MKTGGAFFEKKGPPGPPPKNFKLGLKVDRLRMGDEEIHVEERKIPDRQTALGLLRKHQPGKPELAGHCVAVAGLAVALAQALNDNGLNLDVDLVEAAALLHDICKGEPSHDQAAGRLLRSMGYHEVAAVAEVHTRLGGRVPEPHEPIGEDEVVYLADKSFRRTRRVSIEDRYAIWINSWLHDPQKLESLRNGQMRAETVRARVEKALGRRLDAIEPEVLRLK